jgi:hypothetical protein
MIKMESWIHNLFDLETENKTSTHHWSRAFFVSGQAQQALQAGFFSVVVASLDWTGGGVTTAAVGLLSRTEDEPPIFFSILILIN